MGFWKGVKNCHIGLGNGLEITDKLIGELNSGLEVLNVKLDEKNNEYEAKKPFVNIKMKARKIRHNAHIASIVIPENYKYTHELINCIDEITNIVIALMDASIENPQQRNAILKTINACENEMMKQQYNDINDMKNAMLEELYSRGLDRNADMADKIRFILEQESVEEGNLEDTICEVLPEFQEALKSVINMQSNLKKKGIVIN